MTERHSKITQLNDKANAERLASADNAEDLSSKAQRKPAKGIYVLPNLFTTAGLFAGFYAIMQARLGHYEAACLAIYVAMVMDTLDGRLARLTNTMSDFGSEYDSLADMVSFGVAPAMILYEFALSELGRIGSLVAFIYVACAAIRLARFNVQQSDDKRYFVGVPSPGAAAMIASIIWVCIDYDVAAADVKHALLVVMALVALSMVSNIQYRSFKDVDFRDKMPFIGLIVLVLVISIIYLDPPLAFLSIGTIYLVGGTLAHLVKSNRSGKNATAGSDDESD